MPFQKSGVPREELFLTSKIWMSNASYEKAKSSIDKSLQRMKTDYLDLMLIHQPFGDYYGAYRAMEEAYKAGKLRAIGVSNFYPDRLIDLCQFAETKPMVNQVETHVFQQQKTAHEYMKKYGVQHEAWGPFAEGKKSCFTNPVLVEIGQKSRQNSRRDRPAVSHPVRCGGDSQIHPQGEDGAEPECVRFYPERC